MSEQDDILRDLDNDEFADDGWDEEFEVEAPAPARARARARPAGPGQASRVAAVRRSFALPDQRIFLVIAAALVVALPACAGLAVALVASGGDLGALLSLPVWGTPSARAFAIFWAGALASILLAGGGAWLVVSTWRRGAVQLADARATLRAVTGLDLEDPRGWQAPQLQDDAELSAFTERLLGTYRLQQAKLTRYVALEGELHRLGKSIARVTREDLEGQWDNAAVGTVADEVVHHLDELARLTDELTTLERLLADHGPDLVAQLVEARGWSTGAVEQINLQGAAVERLAVKLARASDPGPDRGAGADLARLVDRASKLAFQIAMEVAKLGSRGERLQPMTQDLEELTTELRGVMAGQEGPQANLAELEPSARQLAGSFQQVARSVGLQAQRLEQILQLASTVTGIEVPATAVTAPVEQPGSGLLVDRFDPFHVGESAGVMADPFAHERSIFNPAPPSSDFSQSVLPDVAVELPEEIQAIEEPVHDLDEFDAVRLPEPGEGLDPERIWELIEFDAVRIA